MSAVAELCCIVCWASNFFNGLNPVGTRNAPLLLSQKTLGSLSTAFHGRACFSLICRAMFIVLYTLPKSEIR